MAGQGRRHGGSRGAVPTCLQRAGGAPRGPPLARCPPAPPPGHTPCRAPASPAQHRCPGTPTPLNTTTTRGRPLLSPPPPQGDAHFPHHLHRPLNSTPTPHAAVHFSHHRYHTINTTNVRPAAVYWYDWPGRQHTQTPTDCGHSRSIGTNTDLISLTLHSRSLRIKSIKGNARSYTSSSLPVAVFEVN